MRNIALKKCSLFLLELILMKLKTCQFILLTLLVYMAWVKLIPPLGIRVGQSEYCISLTTMIISMTGTLPLLS